MKHLLAIALCLFALNVGAVSTNGFIVYLSTDGSQTNIPGYQAYHFNNPSNTYSGSGAGLTGIIASGIYLYNSGVTNPINTNYFALLTSSNGMASGSRLYTTITNNTYVGNAMTTSRYTTLEFPVVIDSYNNLEGAGSATAHAEIYVTYDGTNMTKEWSSGTVTLDGISNTPKSFVVNGETYQSTNNVGFFIRRAEKIDIQSSTPNLRIYYGPPLASFTTIRSLTYDPSLGVRGATGIVHVTTGGGSWYDTTNRILHEMDHGKTVVTVADPTNVTWNYVRLFSDHANLLTSFVNNCEGPVLVGDYYLANRTNKLTNHGTLLRTVTNGGEFTSISWTQQVAAGEAIDFVWTNCVVSTNFTAGWEW